MSDREHNRVHRDYAPVQRFMRESVSPLEGTIVEWRLRWRLTDDRLEIEVEREITDKQLAALRAVPVESLCRNLVKARARRNLT